MAVARKLLVDLEVSRHYHCISRCVRRAFLWGEGFEHRKQWIEQWLELLAGNFAVSVCGFSIMDNHLQCLARLDPGIAKNWSSEEVVRRWISVYLPPTLDVEDPKDLSGKPMVQKALITQNNAEESVLVLSVPGKQKHDFTKFMQIRFVKRKVGTQNQFPATLHKTPYTQSRGLRRL